jgi:hypothetical protein
MREPNQEPTSLVIGPPLIGELSDCKSGSMGDDQPTTEPLLKAAMFTVEKKILYVRLYFKSCVNVVMTVF